MNFEELLNILTYYQLQEFSSGTGLIQALQKDDYASQFIALAGGLKHLTCFDTVNDFGVEPLLAVFTERSYATEISVSQHRKRKKKCRGTLKKSYTSSLPGITGRG